MKRRLMHALAAIAVFQAMFAMSAMSQQTATPPLPRSAAPRIENDSLVAGVLGTYVADRGPDVRVSLGSLGRGVVMVKRGAAWDGVGFWNGRECHGVARSPMAGSPARGGTMFGTLRFRSTSPDTLLAEINLGGVSTRETWMRKAAFSDRESRRDSSPVGEYVYVEELPEVVTKMPPIVPEEARKQGILGTVLVQALVGADGRVKETRVTKSIPLLDDAAVSCVRQWVFKPALSKGKPVAVWVAVPVRFSP